ncbi:site-specific DNA-methyltransferase [Bradyrhizobium sp. BRP22]|uniref:DNA-methyltransferase n=1 Tax=Bradyrhizobium sp. BRP22 TaxID=2793821 RepID=UPI001CD3F4AD|nr:site-specific DNA-methyltransferase [Bradyrhizobium sp. BRP22]MCA1458052.1 site-specific DNA-methyltransferase [Bradyrhizobium sp. BRP22]
MKVETFLDGRVTMLIGDVREGLTSLDADSYDCVPTSPPYWGLRDYGVEGQIGLEPTLGAHLDVMVEVFGRVRRVLKPTGTLWLNYGDCYAASPNGRSAADTKAAGNDDRTFRDKPFSTVGPVNSRVGRSENLGNRGSDGVRRNGGRLAKWDRKSERSGHNFGAADESVADVRVMPGGYLKPKDLCMIPNRLAIALQDDGWWVRSEIVWHKPNPMPESTRDRPTNAHEKIWLLTKRERYFYDADAIREPDRGLDHPRNVLHKPEPSGGVMSPHTGIRSAEGRNGQGANARNVWTLATAAFSEAHFATFPPALVERCIKAGCPTGGRVLDPFGGAGTTAMVAVALGRTATLIELNPEYARLARARIEAAFMSKAAGARHMVKKLGKAEPAGPLFEGAAE